MPTDDLAPGMLLAAPSLRDPNFMHSVVLLGRAGDDGALGWVVNGRELMSVRELLTSSDLIPRGQAIPDTRSFASAVRIGGPVAPAAGWLLYRRLPEPLPGEITVGADLGVTGELAAFSALLLGRGPSDFRLLLGCAGWAPGQLEAEIGAGAWLPAAVSAALVMDAEAAFAWDEAYRLAVGTEPAAFSRHRGKA
ncbi:MAG: YqgE/AlgH family protein [Deltaproteobacteria bacterium]|jgi:putative transcriptional regulator|nr:YqgE/AlgH family protein [Deltaproteobacteria bacterium]